jgi:hypothetical protein
MTKQFAICTAFSLLAVIAGGCCCIDRPYCPPGCGGYAGADCGGCSLAQHAHTQLGSCAGCGDVYWGEWTSDPPDPCDPCDGCGNWVGPRCCPPRLFSFLTCSLSDLWGSRCCGTSGGCDHGGGCSSCGGSGGGELGPWDGMEFGEGDFHSPQHGEPRKATPVPQSNSNKPKVDTNELPQPMAEPQARHSRSMHHAPTKAVHMQPTQSKRPTYQRSAASRTRQRSL